MTERDSEDDSARIVEAMLETLIQLQDVAAEISVATKLMGGQLGNLAREGDAGTKRAP
jgi:hypothetical protein